MGGQGGLEKGSYQYEGRVAIIFFNFNFTSQSHAQNFVIGLRYNRPIHWMQLTDGFQHGPSPPKNSHGFTTVKPVSCVSCNELNSPVTAVQSKAAQITKSAPALVNLSTMKGV